MCQLKNAGNRIFSSDHPSISLVTPCYNHAEFVGDTIKSVLSQGYPKLEYIVINDGSTDESEAVIQQYAQQLHHWETWPGTRPGPAPAINRGFSFAGGEIMGWLNSDDLLMSKSLFVVAEVFSQFPQVDWLTGVATTIDSKGRYVRSRKYRKNRYDYLVGDWAVIQQESTFWRRSLWNSAGAGLDPLSVAFDSELWCRFFLHAEHYHLDCPVGAYRKVSQSTSVRNASEFARATEKALGELRENVAAHNLRRSSHYRFFKWLLRMFGSPVLRPRLGRLFGVPDFQYKSISYEPVTGKWRMYSEW